MQDDKRTTGERPENAKPVAPTGNASNPTPYDEELNNAGNEQLLGKGAEKYLREVASIEDYPDPQEQKEAEDTLDGENNKEQ